MLLSKILSTATAGLTLMTSLPIAVNAEYDLERPRALQPSVCAPQPIRVTNNGTNPIFAEEKYLVVHLQETSNRTDFVDVIALDAMASQAYQSSIDCSLSSGSIRNLTNCTTVISNIIFERDAILMKCAEYASNSVDGSTVFSTADIYSNATCSFPCGDPPTQFPAFQSNNDTCPGSCTGSQINCACYAPFEDDFIDEWNKLYTPASDVLGKNVTIVNVTDARVLRNCGLPNITYDATSVCLPGLPAGSNVSSNATASPTKGPTRSPTKKPTKKPTRKPTKKPTSKPSKKPTSRPTAHPTTHPTKNPTSNPTRIPTPIPTTSPTRNPTPIPTTSPTRNPTPIPTRNPTPLPTDSPTRNPTPLPTDSPTRNPTPLPTVASSSKGICDYICEENNSWSNACTQLVRSGLCSTLNNANETFTFFVSTNAGFNRLRNTNDFTESQWNDKFEDIMRFNIIERQRLSPAQFACPTSSFVTLQGERITIECVVDEVRGRSISLFQELIDKWFVTGDCNSVQNSRPQLGSWYGALNGYIIETDDLALPDSFLNCTTAAPTGSPSSLPTSPPSVLPTIAPTASPSESSYPSNSPT